VTQAVESAMPAVEAVMPAVEAAKLRAVMTTAATVMVPCNLAGVEIGGGVTMKRISKKMAVVTCLCLERVRDRSLSHIHHPITVPLPIVFSPPFWCTSRVEW
jgi:hypothetical protein